MKLLRDALDPDGRLLAVSRRDPRYSILLTRNGSSDAAWRVTSFRETQRPSRNMAGSTAARPFRTLWPKSPALKCSWFAAPFLSANGNGASVRQRKAWQLLEPPAERFLKSPKAPTTHRGFVLGDFGTPTGVRNSSREETVGCEGRAEWSSYSTTTAIFGGSRRRAAYPIPCLGGQELGSSESNLNPCEATKWPAQ